MLKIFLVGIFSGNLLDKVAKIMCNYIGIILFTKFALVLWLKNRVATKQLLNITGCGINSKSKREYLQIFDHVYLEYCL